MIQRPKWIHDATADEAAVDVGRRVLIKRLETIIDYLPHAAKLDRDVVEDVHQLRVGCRRAEVALRVFRNIIRPRQRKKLHRQISRLRRAASVARDLDMLQANLQHQYGHEQTVTASGEVASSIAQRRLEAQKPIRRAYRRWKRSGSLPCILKRFRNKFWRKDAARLSFGQLGVIALNHGVADFFDKGERLDDLSSLHEMRKSGKRLRYTIELLSVAFATSWRTELYESFVDVQDRLGIVNDHAVAARLAGAWADKCNEPMAAEFRDISIRRSEQMEIQCSDFRHWWTKEKTAELKQRFDEAIASVGA